MKELTLGIIKPDAVSKNKIGEIIKMIEDSGLKIKAMKVTRLTKKTAQEFYSVHKERPFFDSLVDFMIQGPVVPMILEGENAIAEYRKLMGATDFTQAEEGTIRKKYATSIESNAVHGSDSSENAEIEMRFFFSGEEAINIY